MTTIIDARNSSGSCGSSAVAWPAIIAGAVTAAAVSLVLFLLGSGIGLSFMSPWAGDESSPVVLTAKVAAWVVLVQWLSSALGGYLTGRLRTKSADLNAHTGDDAGLMMDEIFFRDTAHGFLSWALSTLVTATLLASALSAVAGSGVKIASETAGGAAQAAAQNPGGPADGPIAYFTDTLYRTTTPETGLTTTGPRPDPRAETARILTRSMDDGDVSPADRTYLAQLVSARTGLSPAEASARVDGTLADLRAAQTEAKEAADKARKTAAAASIFTCLSMVIGAFIAAVSAALGGRHRDQF